MKKIGRNAPCPCGSGKKHKHCCMARSLVPRSSGPYTEQERASALARLDEYSGAALDEEDDEAYDDLLGDKLDRWLSEDVDDELGRACDEVHDAWFWFDRPLDDGRLVVERFLAEGPSTSPGERRFLELAAQTCMRLYEVEDACPGVSVSLREVLDGSRTVVREHTFSRQAHRGQMLAARLIPGPRQGELRLEQGMLHIPDLLVKDVIDQLAAWRDEHRLEHPAQDDSAFWKEAAPFFLSAWVAAILDPPIPRLANTDGEEMVITRSRFDVDDPQRLAQALDRGAGLAREEEGPSGAAAWGWTGRNAKGEPVVLGRLELDGAELRLEANSVARGERGRALVEELGPGLVRHRATTHEDMGQALRAQLRSPRGRAPVPEPPGDIPAETLEDLVLDRYAQHYRSWLDEPIKALEGRTPRAAAHDGQLRPELVRLIRQLEGDYQSALRRGEPAYDPSWMWRELELPEGAPPPHPPPLHHERMAEAVPGLGELCRAVAERVRRRPDFDDRSTLVRPDELLLDLEVQRFLRARREACPTTPDGTEPLATHLLHLINYELHRRKTFWVDDGLAYLLAQTDLEVSEDELRLPFASFALVFTDRPFLSLAERLVARDGQCPLAGHFLRVVVVHVTEAPAPDGRVLHLGFALDSGGADPPHLVEHDLILRTAERIELPGGGERPRLELDGQELSPPPRPLPGLVQVTLNAILYATSATVEPQLRTSPRQASRRPGSTPPERDLPAISAEQVFYLPGSISISHVRHLQELERAPGGRKLLHRFLVRGHWRRPAPSWKDQRLRWIEPYWKGPALAAVIEKAYKLRP